MTGKTNDAIRLQIVQDEIQRETQILEEYRELYRTASQGIQSAVEKLKKLEDQRIALQGYSLGEALTTYTNVGENSAGYQWLRDRTEKGQWLDTGFGYQGEYWSQTNQYCLGVRVGRSWDDARLRALADLILQAMPVILPGGAADPHDPQARLKLTAKGSSTDPRTMRVLKIGTASHNTDWLLGWMESGEWVVFDRRNIRYDRARLTGTLMECLEEIRAHLPARIWSESLGDEDEED